MNKINFLPPWVETNLQPAFYDLESGTCLQQTARMYNKVNELVRITNETAEQFQILHDFVYDYFDNLDVQEEVNKKLEEMAEDGTLGELVAQELFNNLYVNDNFTIDNRKVVDNYRTLTYWVTKLIPNTDKIEYVPLKGKTSQDTLVDSASNPINMFEFSTKVNSIFVSNSDSSGSFINTAIIRDKEILNEGGSTTANVLTIDDKGDLDLYDGTTPASVLVESHNVVNSWGASSWIIDGEKNLNTNEPTYDARHPRTVVLQEYDSKNIIFLHIEGRRPDSVGVTFDEGAELVLAIFPNVRVACSLGGGGDTQLMLKGRMINDCNDNQLRKLYDFFYLDPNITSFDDIASKEIADARMSEETLHDFLKSRVNLTETYLSATHVLTAKFSNHTNYENRFICEVDYNTTLEVGDTILVTFPDVSTNVDVVYTDPVTLNIHFAGSTAQPSLRDEYGLLVKPGQISNKTFLLQWDGTRYNILKIFPTVGTPASNENKDLNNILDYSMQYSNSFTNKPSYLGASVGAGVEITIPLPIKNYYMQFYFERPSNNIYMRCNENGTWNSWNRVADKKGDLLTNKNLSTEVINALYIGYGNSLSNRPTGSSNGWAINIPGASAGYNCQIFIERQTGDSDGRMYLRLEENGVWKSWKQIAFEA